MLILFLLLLLLPLTAHSYEHFRLDRTLPKGLDSTLIDALVIPGRGINIEFDARPSDTARVAYALVRFHLNAEGRADSTETMYEFSELGQGFGDAFCRSIRTARFPVRLLDSIPTPYWSGMGCICLEDGCYDLELEDFVEADSTTFSEIRASMIAPVDSLQPTYPDYLFDHPDNALVLSKVAIDKQGHVSGVSILAASHPDQRFTATTLRWLDTAQFEVRLSHNHPTPYEAFVDENGRVTEAVIHKSCGVRRSIRPLSHQQSRLSSKQRLEARTLQ